MPSVRRNSAHNLAITSEASDSRELNALLNSLKSARGKGLSLEEFLTMTVAREIQDRWGPNDRNHLGHELVRSLCEFENGNQHTIDHVDCPVCQAFDELVKADLLGMARQTFPEAAKVWQRVRSNSNSLRDRTHEAVDEYITALSKFFRNIQMCAINPGMLESHQVARKSNAIAVVGKVHRPWARTASHSRINHELNVLGQMLRACNEWEKIRPYYFPLSVPKWSPRQILSEKEEEDLFKNVAGYPGAELAYCVAAITNNTTASGVELRCLKLENVFLRPAGEISEIYIPPEACKNDNRPRKIDSTMLHSGPSERVYQRAIKLGSTNPEHYLFPFRTKRDLYDPTQPATRWFLRCSWNHLRDISGFHHLRPHDLRHHAITRMLENGVDGDLVNAISGHVSQRMREFYSHQRTRVKYEAAQQLNLSMTFENWSLRGAVVFQLNKEKRS